MKLAITKLLIGSAPHNSGANISDRNVIEHITFVYSHPLLELSHTRCEFQKRMRLRGAKSICFHRSGCDCVQKSMRPVLQYTKVVATSFCGQRRDSLWVNGESGRERREFGWTNGFKLPV